ncbi:MAG: DNA-binding protein [Lachnospiraceae bacterium]|nr:DNA-binding protein [Lachnospiraceae bacterium]
MNTQADTDEKLREIVKLSGLYDLYGELLNDHTREIFEAYILDNYSLAEIAEEQNMTRQGVRDIVVRGSKKLNEFDEKLGFSGKLKALEGKLEKLSDKLSLTKENLSLIKGEKEAVNRVTEDIEDSLSMLKEAAEILET